MRRGRADRRTWSCSSSPRDPRAGLALRARPDGGRRVAHPLVKDLPLLGWFWEIANDLLVVWPPSCCRRPRGIAPAVPAPGSAGRSGPGGRRDGARGGWRFGVDGRAHGDGSAAGLSAVRVALASALIATTAPHLGRPIRRVGRWVIILGSLGVVALAAARRGLGSGDRVRVRGARAPRVRITRRTPVAGTGPGGARGARGGSRRSAGGRAPAQGRRPPARRDAAGAAAPRQGLRARRVGRPAAHVDVVLPGTGTRRRRSRSAAGSRWSTRRSSRCSPSAPGCRCCP